ncbi:hypothetical protein CDV36_003715 [Fusarium kuroshium]|uniref:Uncharacterized protein n=2 Tax=Fusarium solani species complex TaxID=232080 RepID=A0A3M2SHH8_9HYPO|nr:hypothetical protein CDV36_003715 [Fusarium kuroshium]RSL38346.1 hypothetical protein CEP53_014942 [Fusarium sp. AF-6]RSM12553.1 hypothetical protein CEP52_002354 [Fusarium oligoseptatum]
MPRQADLAVETGEVRSEAFEMESPHAMSNINEPSTDNMANVAMIEPIPPNGGYGWVCAFAVFLINSHTWGINAASSLKSKIKAQS